MYSIFHLHYDKAAYIYNKLQLTLTGENKNAILGVIRWCDSTFWKVFAAVLNFDLFIVLPYTKVCVQWLAGELLMLRCRPCRLKQHNTTILLH